MSKHRKTWGAALFLLAITVAAYWPSLDGGFILDDDKLITENHLIQSPSGLSRIWLSLEPQDYWPLTNTAFWLEWRVWHTNPTGYHVVNLLLQIASAMLIWRILAKLGIPGALIAAIFFVIHPVNVESVAWISQQKNTLSLLFFLFSVAAWLNFDAAAEVTSSETEAPGASVTNSNAKHQGSIWYAGSLFCFLLAMLAKGSVAIGPLFLLLIAWWRRGRISLRDLLRIAPFFAIAAVLTAVNIWFQTHGSGEATRQVDFAQRLAGSGAVIWFYLSKALLPIDLIFVYSQWQIDTANLCWWIPLLAAATATVALFGNCTHWLGHLLLFAWIFFCIGLVPVLGFIDVGFMRHSLVADHYQQISLIAAAAIIASVIGRISQRGSPLASAFPVRTHQCYNGGRFSSSIRR